MLHDFLATHRLELIERCKFKVARRPAPAPAAELEHGIPLFLEQLTRALVAEQSAEPLKDRLARRSTVPARAVPVKKVVPAESEIGKAAGLHGRELLHSGFTIDQVVHAYDDLCQAVTELATEKSTPIGVDEFRTLNRCLDRAIAQAVTEFSSEHESSISEKSDQTDEQMRVFGLELRRNIRSATLAVAAVKAGNVGLNGATGAILDLSLVSLGNLVNRTLGPPVTSAASAPLAAGSSRK